MFPNPAVYPRRVVVTGLGVLSCLGVGTRLNWERILKGESGIRRLDGKEWADLPCRLAGTIPRGDKPGQLNLEQHFSANERRTLPLATMYALVAAEEALLDSGWRPTTEEDCQRSGVAVGMGMISLDDVVTAGRQLEVSHRKISPHFIPRILTNMAAGHISIRHKFKGPNHSVSTACATGLHAIGDAFRFIRYGDADVMLCGGTEAAVTPLAVAGFSRLGALCADSPTSLPPERASRPFDTDRSGFVLSEGAGILVLEEREHALRRGARAYAEVLGYGISSDAHHATAPPPDGDGAYRCMRAALSDARLLAAASLAEAPASSVIGRLRRVTYVNAHATSTPLGDDAEAAAIERLFGAVSRSSSGSSSLDESYCDVSVSSCKGSLGHLLGAAGSVEALMTALACRDGLLPPTANLAVPSCAAAAAAATTATATAALTFHHVIGSSRPWRPRHSPNDRVALTNSFGFGGTNASLCIGSISA